MVVISWAYRDEVLDEFSDKWPLVGIEDFSGFVIIILDDLAEGFVFLEVVLDFLFHVGVPVVFDGIVGSADYFF